MKSYAESIGHSFIDWSYIIDLLEQNSFSDKGKSSIKEKSASWGTCACGMQSYKIPRNYRGMPNDLKLQILGMCFSHNIIYPDYKRTRIILKQIKRRSKWILFKMRVRKFIGK